MNSHPTQFFAVLAQRDDPALLANAVANAREQMNAAGEIDLWEFWNGRVLLEERRVQEALAAATKIKDLDLAAHLKTLALRVQTQSGGDPQPLFEHLATRYHETNNAVDFYALCEAHLRLGDERFVADRADQLLKLVPTPAALELAIQSRLKAADYAGILQLLLGANPLFPRGELPIEFRRLRLTCEQQLGRIMQVLPEAENLARESRAAEDVARLIQLHRMAADPKKAAITARDLLDVPSPSPNPLIFAAQSVSHEDPALARRLLQKAIEKQDVPTSILPSAIQLSLRLGASDVSQRLFAGLHAAIAKGDENIAKLDENQANELFRQGAEHVQQAWAIHMHAQVPLHALIDEFGISWPLLVENAFNPVANVSTGWPQRQILLTRHGARGVNEEPEEVSRLYLDISALLLADRLNLLDLVEANFAPLFIPAAAVELLMHCLDSSQLLPDDQSKAYTDVIGLADSGDFETISLQEGAIAAQNEGYLIGHAVAPAPASIDRPANERNVNVGELTRALAKAGMLTDAELKPFSNLLSGEPPRDLTLGVPLYLAGDSLEQLTRLGLIKALCATFKVKVERFSVERVRDLLRHEARLHNVASWLRKLLDRIRHGLGVGTWKYIPLSRPTNGGPGLKFGLRCVNELIQAEAGLGHAVWCDDRYLNAFARIGEVPIITLLGVLKHLRRRDRLSKDDYWLALHRLRESEVRFLPITPEEIIHYVKRASLNGLQLVESHELKVLRRYVSLMLTGRGILQTGPETIGAHRPTGEVPYVFELYNSITLAISELWKNRAEPTEEVAARADWVLHELWFDPAPIAELAGLTLPADARLRFPGGAISHLYYVGITLSFPIEDDKNPRLEEYLRWVYSRTAHDYNSLSGTARWLNEIMNPRRFTEQRSPTILYAFRRVLSRFYFALPRSLKQHLALNDARRTELGIATGNLVNVGILSFEAKEYWKAAQQAFGGEEATVVEEHSQKQYRLCRHYDGDKTFLRHESSSGETAYVIAEPFADALSRNRRRRVRSILSQRDWFETDAQTADRIAARIANIRDIPKRMNALIALKQRSAAFHYSELGRLIEQPNDLKLSDFEPPATSSLLAYLRLVIPDGRSLVASDYELAANRLVEGVGLHEAIRRFAMLPIRLPDNLVDRLINKYPIQRTVCLEALDRDLISPVSRIHLAGLYWMTGGTESEQAREILAKVAEQEFDQRLNAFDSLLIWTTERIVQNTREKAENSSILLGAWLHAGLLFSFLAKSGPTEQIARFFEENLRFEPRDIFHQREAFISDAAHPRSLQNRRLLLQAIAAAIPRQWSLSEIPEYARELGRKLAFIEHEGKRVPDFRILQMSGRATNCLGSYLGEDRATLLKPLLDADAASFSADALNREMASAIAQLQEEPIKASLWILLSALLGKERAPDALKPSFEAILLKSHLGEFSSSDEREAKMIMFFQAIHASSAPVQSHLRGALATLATRKNWLPSTDSEEKAEMILEAAHQLAVALQDEESRSRFFTETMLDVLEAWPEGANTFWRIIRTLFLRLPWKQSRGLWPLVLALRTATQKVTAFAR